MTYSDPRDRPSFHPEAPCIYWTGFACGAISYFTAAAISCYNDGRCNGEGTCRGCSKYDQGGLKLDVHDDEGGTDQFPMNLQVYNVRARIAPCCFWSGVPGEFVRALRKTNVSAPYLYTSVSSSQITLHITRSTAAFPPDGGQLLLYSSGAYKSTIPYTSTVADGFVCALQYTDVAAETELTDIFLGEQLDTPVYVPLGESPSSDAMEHQEETSCTLAVAAAWQAPYTAYNPTAYGCNGAKPECPYYTGPRFTEVIDRKMDKGDPVTAKQVMELRYYSRDWTAYADPRDAWEKAFEYPDIWAWPKDPEAPADLLPGYGRFDENGNPLVQKVTISTFGTIRPVFDIQKPETIAVGTRVVGGPPEYPDYIREITAFLDEHLEVLWPANTSVTRPLVRKTFVPSDRVLWIAASYHSRGDVVAINLTKHPQGGTDPASFIAAVQRDDPDGVYSPMTTGLPGATFAVQLEYGGATECLNHIRLFMAGGLDGTTYQTADVYVLHIFHHAHVAQTRFSDLYGHTMVDPWVNHFTRLEIDADVIHLTNNTVAQDVFWHTTASNGKKTLYAIETQEVTSSETDDISWEPIGCGYIAVTFNTTKVNRVYPWKAWGNDSREEPLFVVVDRSANDILVDEEDVNVEMELTFASTAGSAIPANVAIFKPKNAAYLSPFDPVLDIVRVRYAYTTYKQGPLAPSDLPVLKFPSDVSRIIEVMPYEVRLEENKIQIDGTHTIVGGEKFYSCDQVLGDCYTEIAGENEVLARQTFANGGLGGEEDILKPVQLVNECAERFNAAYGGGETGATFTEVANKLGNMHLAEGSQHYTVVFADTDGRPIGVKNVAFLTQSAIVQTRDVEIRYKWLSDAKWWPIHDQMILLASFYQPLASQPPTSLIYQRWPYDPYCGDHAENLPGIAVFRAFDLGTDSHGALWYPYKQCQKPRYHDQTWSEVSYGSFYVEGFVDEYADNRRDYWEKMRTFDRYTPAIYGYIPQAGCYWSRRTGTLETGGRVSFDGYTKIRSLHPFGPYSTDRESLRLSRHWEKRNIEIAEETYKQEADGWTLDLTSENAAALYDEDGNLRQGSGAATPIWVHINDGISVVSPASETRQHPFGNLLLQRVGTHQYGEVFDDTRVDLSTAVEERDYTRNTDRLVDGYKVYLPDGTTLNSTEGTPFEAPGTDIVWVYKQDNISWVWLADPPDPVRSVGGSARIGGIHIGNPAAVLFKKNFRPATHTLEGTHNLIYTPHEFEDDGTLKSAASISLDGGPHLYISQGVETGTGLENVGWVYILASEKSPYDEEQHLGEDYQFVLHGLGPGGAGLLADTRGLQRYEVGGTKYATFAGISLSLTADIDELPYVVQEIRDISRLNVEETPATQTIKKTLDAMVKEYSGSDDKEKNTGLLDFKGHYYVETVEIDFVRRPGVDVPIVEVWGVNRGEADETLLAQTSYLGGDPLSPGESVGVTRVLAINKRLKGLRVLIGRREDAHGMIIEKLEIGLREHTSRTELVYLYAPKVQVSRGDNGTHRPSDLEFYFERIYQDHCKNYLSGLLSLGTNFQDVTKIAGVQTKYSTRRIKDRIPMFEFTDLEGSRFPYDNIDFSAIPGFTTKTTPAGTFPYIAGSVATCSKGWTMHTTNHADDPSDSLSHEYAYNKQLLEDGQESLYQEGARLLGDKVAVYRGFWHPEEVSFFAQVGVDLSQVTWVLEMYSAVAPLDRVFRHEEYGCIPAATNENLDGLLHRIENWQARGVFHYSCSPAYNYVCFAVVMNKCSAYLFQEYGTADYNENNVASRFTYVFTIPPRDGGGYLAAGLIDKNYTGGRWGGSISNAAYVSARTPPGVGLGYPQGSGAFFFLELMLNARGATPFQQYQ